MNLNILDLLILLQPQQYQPLQYHYQLPQYMSKHHHQFPQQIPHLGYRVMDLLAVLTYYPCCVPLLHPGQEDMLELHLHQDGLMPGHQEAQTATCLSHLINTLEVLADHRIIHRCLPVLSMVWDCLFLCCSSHSPTLLFQLHLLVGQPTASTACSMARSTQSTQCEDIDFHQFWIQYDLILCSFVYIFSCTNFYT